MIGLLYERLTMAADVPHDGDCLRAIFLFKGLSFLYRRLLG